jgi:hypothetical protein
MNMYQLNQIPSEAKIRQYLRQIIFGKNMFCPNCRSNRVYAVQGRYRCRKCRIRFSLLSHTWLSNMKLPLQQFWLLLWCWTVQVPVKQTMAFTNLSEPTIRLWFDQFRAHLPADEQILEAVVQLDEAYFGGKKGYALLMGKQAGTRKLAYHILSEANPAKCDAAAFLQTYVKPGTILHTDGSSIYKKISDWWPVEHKRDMHKKFEFELTSEIEGMFGVYRTFIRRMYHHVTRDKFPHMVGEFCYRFSHPELFRNPRHYLLITLRLVPTA